MACVQLADSRANVASLAEGSALGGNPGGIPVSRSRRAMVACGFVGLVGAAAAAVAWESVASEYRSMSDDLCPEAKVTVCNQVMCKKKYANGTDVTTKAKGIAGGHFTMVYTKMDGQVSWLPTNVLGVDEECQLAVAKAGVNHGTIVKGVTVQVLPNSPNWWSFNVLHDGQMYNVNRAYFTKPTKRTVEPAKIVPELPKEVAAVLTVRCTELAAVEGTDRSWDQTCPVMKEDRQKPKQPDGYWTHVILTDGRKRNLSKVVPTDFFNSCVHGSKMEYGWRPTGIPVGATVFKIKEHGDYTKVVVDVHYKGRWVPTWVLSAPVVKVDRQVYLKQVLKSPALGTVYHRVSPIDVSGNRPNVTCPEETEGATASTTTKSEPDDDTATEASPATTEPIAETTETEPDDDMTTEATPEPKVVAKTGGATDSTETEADPADVVSMEATPEPATVTAKTGGIPAGNTDPTPGPEFSTKPPGFVNVVKDSQGTKTTEDPMTITPTTGTDFVTTTGGSRI